MHTIHPSVAIGNSPVIGEFTIIGIPVPGSSETTRIGANAHIRSHTVIYAGNTIGDNFQTGHHVVIRNNNTIGNDVSIGSGSEIAHSVTIEDDVRIHSHVFIPEGTVLKRGSWIGPCVCITNAPYPLSKNSKAHLKHVTIEQHAKIGANCTLLPGITVGEHALVGAGAVVTKDVPAYTVVTGNPARPVKHVKELKHDDGTAAYEL